MSDGDSRSSRLYRLLLYGSPLAAAMLTLAIRQLTLSSGIIAWWWIDGAITIGNGLLAAFGSATGAVWLPNRLAVRVSHASAAALVSFAVYLVLLSAAISIVS